jgi:ABC-type sugar transport system ATPase subunit
MLAGIHSADTGMIAIDGQPVRFASPAQALDAGVAMVHQELSFCANLSVADNLSLGTLPSRGGFVATTDLHQQARSLLAGIDPDIDVTRPLGSLTIGQQQMVQIAAAIGRGARVIVFDEPTSSLSQHEVDRLYALMDRLKAGGVTCIYVSHRLEEIFRLCDAVTILRDGHHVATTPIGELDQHRLVELMIGRRLEEYFPAHAKAEPREELLRVERLSSPAGFSDVSFQVRAGEVVGFAGLVGAGRSEVARAVFGLDPEASGQVFVRGRPLPMRSVRAAIDAGIGLVPRTASIRDSCCRCPCWRTRRCHCSAGPRASGSCRARQNGNWRARTSTGCACGHQASTPRLRRSPAATSRRSCSRAGWRRNAPC